MYPNDPNQPPTGTQPSTTPPQPGVPPATPAQQPSMTPSAPEQQPIDPWTMPSQPQQYSEPRPSYTPNGMASIDYLNQISTKQKSKFGGFSRKQIGIAGAVILLLFGIIVAYTISNSLGPTGLEKAAQLVARTQSLAEVTSESQQNTKSSALSSLNSALSIQLNSTQHSLLEAFEPAGITNDSIGESTRASESNEELLEKLDNARLGGTFDRAYVREMSYQVEMLLILVKEVQSTAENEEVDKQLQAAIDNIEPLLKRLKEIGETVS